MKSRRSAAKNRLEHFLDGHLSHWIVMIFILINAIILGLETSDAFMTAYGKTTALMGNVIVGVLVVEMALRIVAGGLRVFKKPLDLLDVATVVAAVVFAQPGFTVVRLIRALRVFLLHDISSRMRHILHGMRHAMSGVIHVVGLVLVLFYIFSIVGFALFHHPDVAAFQNIGVAMKAMFQTLTGDDWYNILRDVEKVFPSAWIFFFSFYIVMVFVVLNLFIGAVVGALQVAEEDKQPDPTAKVLKQLQQEIQQLRNTLTTKSS